MSHFQVTKLLLIQSRSDSQLIATAAKSNFGRGLTLLYLLVCISAGVIFQNNAKCLLHTASSMSVYINITLSRRFISQKSQEGLDVKDDTPRCETK